MPVAQIKKGTATGTGVVIALFPSPGGAPFATYALSVKGTGAAPTSWSVTLDVCLDGQNWTTLLTHSSADGSVIFDAAGKPSNWIRVNVGALTLGSATDIVARAVGVS
jgi:hypothetical protein